MNDRARLLDHLLEITVAAASEILKVYQTDFGVDYKSPQDPVTDADRRANALISARLLELMPDVPVVAEESEPGSFARFRESERIFFVDPLDGTRDFVARNGEFVVMIGLVEGTRATVGVVHAPVRGISWAASLGLGAFRVARDGTRTPISVSTTDDPAKAKLVVSRSRRDRDVERAIQLLHVAAAESLGSAGLKGVRVASGSADAYLALNVAGSRWDACAVDALVTAAGGRFTDSRGVPLDYRSTTLRNRGGLLASNGRLHDTIVQRLTEPPGPSDPPDQTGQ
jgi:3'(2'), 5'-bisphosphate nucleotidase